MGALDNLLNQGAQSQRSGLDALLASQPQKQGFSPARIATQAVTSFLGPASQGKSVSLDIAERLGAETPALPVIGGLAGSPFGPLGAGAGSAAGETLRQGLRFGRGEQIDPREATKSIALQGALGLGGEVGGRVLGAAVGFGARKIAPRLSAVFGGTSAKAGERVAEAAEHGRDILTKNNMDIENAQPLFQRAKDFLEESRLELGQKVGNAVEAINDKFGGEKVVELGQLAQRASKILKSQSRMLTGPAKEALEQIIPKQASDPLFGGLKGAAGDFAQDFAIAGRPMPTPSANKSFAEAYDLKRIFQDIASGSYKNQITGELIQVPKPVKGISKMFAKQITNAMNQAEKANLGTEVFKNVNDIFSKRATVYDFLQKHVLGKMAPEAVLGGAMSGKGLRSQSLLRNLNKAMQLLPQEERFLDQALDIIAGSQFKPYVPADLPRTGLTGSLLGLAAFQNPSVLATLPFLSPRIGGNLIQAGARAGKFLGSPAGASIFRAPLQSAPSIFGNR